MTVNNTTSSVAFTGNGVTTVFPYTFRIPVDGMGHVGILDIATSALTVLDPSDYSISGVGSDFGGAVTYNPSGVPIPSTQRIVIYRELDLVQEMDLTNQSPYYPETLEETLDRIVMMMQQVSEAAARAVKVTLGSTTSPDVLVAQLFAVQVAAALSAANAATSESNADASELLASQWATNPEDVPVTTGPDKFSAFHWAEKAAAVVSDATYLDAVSPVATFVFEGDSITYGYATANPATDSWPAQFATMSFASRSLGNFNYGATGTYIATAAARYVASVKPHRPTANGGSGGAQSYLFLMIGINDLVLGTSYATVVADLKSYVDTAIADGFTVVLSTILPATAALAGGYEDDRQIVNSYIRDGYFNTPYVFDGADVLSRSTDGLMFQADGLHPLKEGYTLYAKQMNERLSSGLFPVDAGRILQDQAIDAALHNAIFTASNSSAFTAGVSFTGFNTPLVNNRSCFNATTGVFTAEKDGVLVVSATALNQNSATQGKIQFRKNGTAIGPQGFASIALGVLIIPSTAIPVVRGDTIDLRVTQGTTFAEVLNTSVSGFMLG